MRFLRPGMRTLEFGSGLSTLLFDSFGCEHTALEHLPDYGRRWGNSVVICDLAGDPPWYDWEPPSDLGDRPYGLILIDGRPESIGRNGFRRVADAVIGPQTIVVVDDTHRSSEQYLANWIARCFAMRQRKAVGKEKCWQILVRRRTQLHTRTN